MSKFSHHLQPIQTILMVDEDGILELSPSMISPELVGEKAYGISSLFEPWTLPFIVISSKLMYSYLNKDVSIELLNEIWGRNIQEALIIKGITESDKIIIRSNSFCEDMNERGQYVSNQVDANNVFQSILTFYGELMSVCKDIKEMPVIIQRFVVPLIKGHVSNERRVSKENRDWQIEYENNSENYYINIRNWRERKGIETEKNEKLICPSDNINSVIKIPCIWATQEKLRLHFEWVYDGDNIYLVQVDEEKPSIGVNPKSVVVNADTILDAFSSKVLILLSTNLQEKYGVFSKLQNALLYSKLNMPTAPLYILDSKDEIKNLAEGHVSKELLDDLNYLTLRSLVIRTDIASDDKAKCQMLPRTSEIRSTNAAVSWLQEQCKLLSHDLDEDFIFIFHNFIPASASAFAYAEPNNRTVRIESLWGLPEGLYYYAHDKYYVDTKVVKTESIDLGKIEIVKDSKFKRNFVYPDNTGNWIVGKVSDPYDWEISISETDWIRTIAYQTRRIATAVNTGVSVMWFVDVDYQVYGCNVFPWHHEPYNYIDATAHRNKHKSAFEKEYVIRGMNDLERLKDEIELSSSIKYKYILLRPIEAEMLRNKDIVAEIGEIAKLNDAVIVIEGGVLSHLYYQLVHTGAKVEVKQVFKKDSSSIDYNKLVRDKIPDKIEKNGEHATFSTLSDDIKIQWLKRKLVEESFEVLDANTDDDILAELADATEVMDSIRKELKISKKKLADAQKAKREKAGGFEKGLYLHKTSKNPITNEAKQLETPKVNQSISKWSDMKKSTTQNETITRFKIPLSLSEWMVKASDTGVSSSQKSETIIKGKRENGVLQIEVSVFEPTYEQLSLFEKGKN